MNFIIIIIFMLMNKFELNQCVRATEAINQYSNSYLL